jgi:mannose-6-phosphate isomerase-like protein (cupin superfamily)
MVDISREGNEQLAGECYDRDAADPAALGANALAEPTAESTGGLVSHPHPGKLDHCGAQTRIACLRDALFLVDAAEAKTITGGGGVLIASGTIASLTAGNGEQSALLYFLLAPKEALDQPVAGAPATVKELYRTTAPLPELKPGSYELNLTRVTFPPGMPSNPPHHRSGAALYYIVSGIGANTVAGKMADRGPGSLIYEPFGLVHQWGNPGNEPLTFLAFNINPEGVPAVVPETPANP